MGIADGDFPASSCFFPEIKLKDAIRVHRERERPSYRLRSFNQTGSGPEKKAEMIILFLA